MGKLFPICKFCICRDSNSLFRMQIKRFEKIARENNVQDDDTMVNTPSIRDQVNGLNGLVTSSNEALGTFPRQMELTMIKLVFATCRLSTHFKGLHIAFIRDGSD